MRRIGACLSAGGPASVECRLGATRPSPATRTSARSPGNIPPWSLFSLSAQEEFGVLRGTMTMLGRLGIGAVVERAQGLLARKVGGAAEVARPDRHPAASTRPHDLEMKPERRGPDSRRQPQSLASSQVREALSSPSCTAPQTHEQRIQSVQAKLTPRRPKLNVFAGHSPAQVGRVGLEPTTDGL